MKNCVNLKLSLSILLLILFTISCEDDPIQYQLSTQVSPEGSGSISPISGMYNKGVEVEVTAQPNEEYIFKNWTGDAGGNENPMTIVMTDDMVITANFEKRTYALSVEILGQGTVEEQIVQAKSSNEYPSGTNVQLTAIPEPEWQFVKWDGDHTGTENPLVLTVTEPLSLTAVFEKVNYALTVQIEGQGTVEEEIVAAKSSTDYPSGTTVQLTAIPEEEWEFMQWSGDHVGNENPLVLSIIEPLSLTATFEPINKEQVFVPDDNFEQALIDLGLDDQLDDHVYAFFIKSVAELNLANRQIEDLTGIEAFTALKMLSIPGNLITELDISKNQNLELLNCNNNQISSMDISGNLALGTMFAMDNPLVCLQVNHTQLEKALNWVWWDLTGYFVDDGTCFSLNCDELARSSTYIPDDNFEQALINLGLDNVLDDQVKTIDIAGLRSLDISNKNISDLTGIEDFALLWTFIGNNNAISDIEMMKGLPLKEIDLASNNLGDLDISLFGCVFNLDVRDNNLGCIQVSEDQLQCIAGSDMVNMNVLKDEGVEISLDCASVVGDQTYVPDDNFEQALIDLGLDDILDDYVKTINIINLQALDISGKNISDVTGLEDFKSLFELDCSNNNLSAIPQNFGIDWGPNPAWAGILNLSNNNFSQLDISELNFFRTLDVRNNPLTCIEVNENQLLFYGDQMLTIEMDNGVAISLDCGN